MRTLQRKIVYLCGAMKRLLLLTIVTLLASLSAAGQSGTATIGGRIVDANGPIEGVTVVAIHQLTNAQYYTTTDRHGWYQLLDVLPGGPYTVRIHYFEYKPLTVRGLYTYAGQNTVVDADIEAATTRVHTDEAATSLRLGPELGGGAVPVAPLGFDLVSQRIYEPVAFDVRRETSLDDVARQWTVPTGSNRFQGSAYGFYGIRMTSDGEEAHFRQHGVGGLTLALPLGSEDYQLFGGAQYDRYGLSAAGRFDGRINAENRLELSGGRLAAADGADAWGLAGCTSQLGGGRSSNRAQVGWYGAPASRQLLVSDDFTLAAGRQRLLAGVQFAHQNILPNDSTATRFDVYVQDAVRLGQRLTVTGGIRFCFPFSFSPRLSLYYDVLGSGAVVLRAGTAVYGRAGEGSVWKNLAAIDTRLPLGFLLTLEGIYGQSWRRLFYISTRNILDSRYALTARLERPFANRAWAMASYTRSDGPVTDRALAGFSYKAEYLGHLATTLSLFYEGYNLIDNTSPASLSWNNSLEARLSQDVIFSIAGRDHTLQLTGYYRHSADHTSTVQFGLRYIL